MPVLPIQENHASTQLKRISIAGICLLLVFSVFFLKFWPLLQVCALAAQSCLVWLICCFRTKSLLTLNRAAPDSALHPDLGWANCLSLSRAWLIAFTAGFIFQPEMNSIILLFPALAYFLAALIDRIDGYVARISGQQSLLGEKLDTEFDALGLMVAPLLAVWIGQIHWSYLSVSLAYYLFQAGLIWRRRHNLPVHPLAKNPERRALAGFQMGFLAVVIWPILVPPATVIAGIAFMLPLLIGFCIDWLSCSGRIQREAPWVQLYFAQSTILIQAYLLPIFRVTLCILFVMSLHQKSIFPANSQVELFLVVFMSMCCLMIFLGVLGRISALVFCCLFAFWLMDYAMTLSDILVLMIVVWLMQLGTGNYSFFLWDDHWVKRYDGS
jgi:CDP-diacylglycerol--glycerol-3-phosphate 3-phosphatidyltransferase